MTWFAVPQGNDVTDKRHRDLVNTPRMTLRDDETLYRRIAGCPKASGNRIASALTDGVLDARDMHVWHGVDLAFPQDEHPRSDDHYTTQYHGPVNSLTKYHDTQRDAE